MRSRTSPPLQAHALEALPTRQHVHTYAAASSHVVTLSLPRRRRVFSFFFKRHMHTESIRSSLTLSHSPFLSLLSYHPLAPSLSLSLSLSLFLSLSLTLLSLTLVVSIYVQPASVSTLASASLSRSPALSSSLSFVRSFVRVLTLVRNTFFLSVDVILSVSHTRSSRQH